jgi:hypothetical protein
MKKLILIVVLLWALCWGSSAAQAAGGTSLIAYNSIGGILAGNIWEYSTLDVLLHRLPQFPPQNPIFLIGTSLENYRIGELVGFGTVARPEFYWCNPEYPYDSRYLTKQKLGVAAMLICDPEDRIDLEIPAGVNLHQEIIRQLQERRIDLAAVYVEGTFQEVTYSIAFHVDKKGINLKELSSFTNVYQETELFDWRLAGVLASDPKLSPLLTYGGVPLHLHGMQMQGKIGGHVGKAIPAEKLVAAAYPIHQTELNVADLALEVLVANNRRIVLKASNKGLVFCEHVKVTAALPDGKLALSTRLATLEPMGSEFIDLKPTAEIQGKQVTFSIDPQDEFVDSNKANNKVVLTVP